MIHAAKTDRGYRTMSEELHELCLDVWGCGYNYTLPRGAFLGSGIAGESFAMREDLPRWGAAHEEDFICGIWGAGRYGWPFDDTQALPAPIPAKGQQGFWKIPA